jgi:hypothetical protein
MGSPPSQGKQRQHQSNSDNVVTSIEPWLGPNQKVKVAFDYGSD